MLRVMEIGESGSPRVLAGREAAAPPPAGVLRWIDAEAPEEAELAALQRRFGFHPLAIEDCAHFDQRPKLEQYDDHLFIVTHGLELAPNSTEHPRLLELHSFLGKNYLVTVHDEPLQPLSDTWSRLEADGTAARRGVDFIRYLIADAMVDALFPVVDQLADRIEEIEEELLGRSARPDILEQILKLKRLLVSLRKMLPPQRDVLARLTKREEGHIHPRTVPYFRDVHDHLLRVHESVEANRELLNSVLDAHQWRVSQRTNEIMKRLTIVSAVFLPLAFVTGFFGQNFEALPFASEVWFAVMLTTCAAVPAAMLWFFLRSRWF